MFKVELYEHNGEVCAYLEEAAREIGLKNGPLLIHGALISATISTMDLHSHDEPYRLNDIPLEVSGNGDVDEGKVHLHVTVSSAVKGIYHGHLIDAHVHPRFFVVAYFTPYTLHTGPT